MTHATPLPAWCECRVWLSWCSACAQSYRSIHRASTIVSLLWAIFSNDWAFHRFVTGKRNFVRGLSYIDIDPCRIQTKSVSGHGRSYKGLFWHLPLVGPHHFGLLRELCWNVAVPNVQTLFLWLRGFANCLDAIWSLFYLNGFCSILICMGNCIPHIQNGCNYLSLLGLKLIDIS